MCREQINCKVIRNGIGVANYYEKTGEAAKRDALLGRIADRVGYGEAGSTRDACIRLGTELLRAGKTQEGRRYLWMRTGAGPSQPRRGMRGISSAPTV